MQIHLMCYILFRSKERANSEFGYQGNNIILGFGRYSHSLILLLLFFLEVSSRSMVDDAAYDQW